MHFYSAEFQKHNRKKLQVSPNPNVFPVSVFVVNQHFTSFQKAAKQM